MVLISLRSFHRLICVTPAFLAKTWICVARQGRQIQHVPVGHLGLGNLLVQRKNTAGIDDHLQPLMGGLDFVDNPLLIEGLSRCDPCRT